MICILCLSLFKPGGFPGISKQEKSVYSPGELYKYRHDMMLWFCHGNNMHKAPCLVHAKHYDVGSSNESMTKESFDHWFDMELNITGLEFRKKLYRITRKCLRHFAIRCKPKMRTIFVQYLYFEKNILIYSKLISRDILKKLPNLLKISPVIKYHDMFCILFHSLR